MLKFVTIGYGRIQITSYLSVSMVFVVEFLNFGDETHFAFKCGSCKDFCDWGLLKI